MDGTFSFFKVFGILGWQNLCSFFMAIANNYLIIKLNYQINTYRLIRKKMPSYAEL